MTVHYKTQGFIFKKEDRAEADRVFSVFTQDFGRLEITGKAIRKISSKLRGGIELFYVCDIEFIQGKHKKTLTDAKAVEKFSAIMVSPEKYEVACRISDLVSNFIKGEEKDDDIFGLLVTSFKLLNDSGHCLLIYYYFFWNFMAVLGYAPELSKCAKCSREIQPENVYFSNKEGGTVCSQCFTIHKEAIKVSPDVVKILRLLLKKDWNILFKLKVQKVLQKSLKEITENYDAYLSDKKTIHQ